MKTWIILEGRDSCGAHVQEIYPVDEQDEMKVASKQMLQLDISVLPYWMYDPDLAEPVQGGHFYRLSDI